MSHLTPSTSSIQSKERIGRGAMSSKSQWHGPHNTSIHILDDYSLLNVFHFYRPFLFGEDQPEDVRTHLRGGVGWAGEQWWYRLSHVCQRWRNVILGSASYLGLCLVCTYDTPVADMLAHSPPLPLVIDYEFDDITAEDEEAIILALAQRDRVQRIRFYIPFLKLQRLMVIDGEYPILEYLILTDLTDEKRTALILPETLQMPRLRHLTIDCSIPIRSQLLGPTAGLVTLYLELHHPSTYFQPAVLLQSLSLLPQLEILLILFRFPVPKRDVERQLLRTPITTHVTLPNLHTFGLRAVSAYTESVLSQITAPRLKNILIFYPKQLTFSVPQLLQFIGRTENPKLDRALFHFYGEQVYVKFNPPETQKNGSDMPVAPFSINVDGWHLDWQVSSMAQILNALGQIFSTVEHLILWHKDHCLSSEEHNEVDRAEWLNFLRPFCNVRKLHIDDGLVEELSRCLRLEDGEHSSEVLPELQELTYSGSGDSNDVFTAFIDARQNAGRPVTLIKS